MPKAYAISFNHEPGIFGGNSLPPWFDKLSELGDVKSWPEAEKALKELGFGKDKLKELNAAINKAKSEIDAHHAPVTLKLLTQIQGLQDSLNEFFASNPGDVIKRKDYFQQLNVEIIFALS